MSLILRNRRGPWIPISGPLGSGEHRLTDIPDDERGIAFEVDKMVDYVRQFQNDPVVVKTARRLVELCEAKDKACEMNVILEWVKDHYRYVEDPTREETIQTAASMLREINTPPSILQDILGESLIRRLFGFGVAESLKEPRHPGKKVFICRSCFGRNGVRHSKTSGDCDEAAVLVATLLSAIRIEPRFRFGGQRVGGECDFYHVWVVGKNERGEWIDLDATEKESKPGWVHPSFTCFGTRKIFS